MAGRIIRSGTCKVCHGKRENRPAGDGFCSGCGRDRKGHHVDDAEYAHVAREERAATHWPNVKFEGGDVRAIPRKAREEPSSSDSEALFAFPPPRRQKPPSRTRPSSLPEVRGVGAVMDKAAREKYIRDYERQEREMQEATRRDAARRGLSHSSHALGCTCGPCRKHTGHIHPPAQHGRRRCPKCGV